MLPDSATTQGNKALPHAGGSFQTAVCWEVGGDGGETERWKETPNGDQSGDVGWVGAVTALKVRVAE